MIRFSILLLACLTLAGCLRTRAELRGDGDNGGQQLEQQTQAQQQAAQVPKVTLQQVSDQLNQLTARVTSVEDQIANLNAAKPAASPDKAAQEKQVIDQRFLAYEQELKKIEDEIQALNTAMAQKQAAATPAAAAHGSTFDQAEGLFKKKQWKPAIVEYSKYRDHNKKGKYYAEATYKIGVCFEELHMRDEAKAFFQEVITNHSKSHAAKKAEYRVKHMK